MLTTSSTGSAFRSPHAPLVAALLPQALGCQLKLAAPSSRLCTSVQELIQVVEDGGARIVVGDPAFEGGRCADVMRMIRTQFPSVALLVYVSLTAESLSHVVRVAERGITDCVVYRHDDSPQQFTQLLAQVRGTTLITAMLDALKAELDRLSAPWLDAVSDIYRRPTRYLVTGDLAAAVNTTRQTVYRRLYLAGFQSPRLLVASGRVVRAIELLRDPSRTTLWTAKQLGYHRPEHLTAMVRLLTGVQPAELRHGVDAAGITAAIAHRLTSTNPAPFTS